MLAKRIIPCLDVKDGRVVKGVRFVDLRDAGDPAEAALAGRRAPPPSGVPPRWGVYTHGGRRPAGRDALEWAREAVTLGAGEILLTSMDRDGTKDGYDLELTRAVSEAVSVPVIASGGAGTLAHFHDALTDGCADAALAASLFHFGIHTIAETKRYLAERGVEIRSEP